MSQLRKLKRRVAPKLATKAELIERVQLVLARNREKRLALNAPARLLKLRRGDE